MSTLEPPAAGSPQAPLPAEANVVAGQLPKRTDTPTTHAPTPGVSLAGARFPGQPSLPDWQQPEFAAAMAQFANELFAASPPAAPSTSITPASPALAPTAAPSPTPTLPATTAPAPVPPVAGVPYADVPSVSAPQASLPAASAAPNYATPTGGDIASPFSTAPTFDNLDFGTQLLGTVPLMGNDPALPADNTSPYWMVPEGETTKAAPTGVHTDAFQIEPATDLSLRSLSGTAFDPHAIRREFPILQQRVNGRPLVWLDNAATTQKPQTVIDRISHFYENENSNIHRAAHTLAARATDAYESARESVRRFINAPSKSEIIFVRGATEGINLIAQTWGRKNIGEGDEIVLSWLEHHANIVPWHRLANETGAKLRIAPVDDTGQVILEEYEKLLGDRTRLVAFSQVSNALGTITPAKEMIALAHRHGAKVLLDGAQAISHMHVDVQALDCDFYVFSGHKVFAPTGIGAVYGKSEILEAMQPWQGGGNMIADVTFERIQYQGPPARFEAGTGNIADAVGLGAALDWLARIGIENVTRYEHELLVYATARLATVPGLKMIGTANHKAGVLSFILAGQKTEEVGGLLDKEGIAVRSGHHCAQPILRRFGVEATVRASLAPYNTFEDIDALVAALHRLQSGLGTTR